MFVVFCPCFSSEEDGYDEEEEPDKGDIQAVISTLNAKLEDLQTCHDLIAKHASTLHRSVTVRTLLHAAQVGDGQNTPPHRSVTVRTQNTPPHCTGR